MPASVPEEATLRLLVRNHPGVMSHVCGLFARRGFNLEAIICLPVGDRSRSTLLLRVAEGPRTEQLVRQLRKLEDVLEAALAPDAAPTFAMLTQRVSNS